MAMATALQGGQEPSEPWHPEGYKYRRARVTVDGTKEEAIEEAIAHAKTAQFEGRRNAPTAQPIPVAVGGAARTWTSAERLRDQGQQF